MRYVVIGASAAGISGAKTLRELDKEAEEILLTTNLQEDLEADSLDLFQVINEIEDAFDVKIETEEGIQTVEDLVNFVANNQN